MGLAIVSALLAACCFAAAAHLQHAAVNADAVQGRVGMRALGRIVRTPRWLAGALLAGVGGGLHVTALATGPLIVVQPLGVLSLVLSVLLGARAVADPRRGLIGAGVLAACLGTAGFVAFAANSTGTTMPPPEVARVHAAALVPLVLTAAAWLMRGRLRCVALATGAAMWLGLGSALIAAATRWFRESGMTAAVLGLAAEIVLLMVAGAWLVTQAYANGPPSLVLGILTVVDPLAAVLVGIGAYGELADPSAGLIATLLLSGLVAICGVGLLARVLPDAGRAGARRIARIRVTPAYRERLRILLSTDSFPPDVNGAARFTERLAVALAERGHDVHVVCPARGGAPMHRGVTVHGVPSIRAPFHPTVRICLPWSSSRTASRLMTELRPDVVHLQAHGSVGRVVVAKALAGGVPIVATNHFMPENLFGYLPVPRLLHGAITRFAYRDLLRVYRSADILTAPTQRAADLIVARGLAPVRVVSCGIDLHRFTAPERPATGPTTVLFVGRLDVEKHVDVLVKALDAATREVDLRAEIVGDGMCRPELTELAERLGIADRVRFHGFVSDTELLEIYRRADIFCLPGTAELQSIATMEAMAAGLPVLGANAMALPHLIRDGANGYLFPPGDVATVARRLVELGRDGELRRAMGRASRTIIAEHDLAATVATFEGMYREAMGMAAPPPGPDRPEEERPEARTVVDGVPAESARSPGRAER